MKLYKSNTLFQQMEEALTWIKKGVDIDLREKNFKYFCILQEIRKLKIKIFFHNLNIYKRYFDIKNFRYKLTSLYRQLDIQTIEKEKALDSDPRVVLGKDILTILGKSTIPKFLNLCIFALEELMQDSNDICISIETQSNNIFFEKQIKEIKEKINYSKEKEDNFKKRLQEIIDFYDDIYIRKIYIEEINEKSIQFYKNKIFQNFLDKTEMKERIILAKLKVIKAEIEYTEENKNFINV